MESCISSEDMKNHRHIHAMPDSALHPRSPKPSTPVEPQAEMVSEDVLPFREFVL